MPSLSNEHRLVYRLGDAELFHRITDWLKPARS
jgi:hypothetical protein